MTDTDGRLDGPTPAAQIPGADPGSGRARGRATGPGPAAHPEGERVAHPDYPLDVDAEELRAWYRDMVLVRRIDAEATALQRQGELGIWAQPARPGGRADRLRPRAAPRRTTSSPPTASTASPGAAASTRSTLLRPVPRGRPRRLGPGRAQLPPVHDRHRRADPARHRLRDGHPARRRGRHRRPGRATPRSIAYFGDGATAQGDVNEAFVFAASFNAPVVFFCQNNQWAISEPIERQTRVPLYQRAHGLRLPRRPGRRQRRARRATPSPARRCERARSGEGPTFIEAFTYRMGAHTTSDDPTRYRIAAEVEELEAARTRSTGCRRYLARTGLADEDVLRRGRGRGRRAGRRGSARALPGAARPRAADDVRPRLRRAAPAARRGARPGSPPTSARSRRPGGAGDDRTRHRRPTASAARR